MWALALLKSKAFWSVLGLSALVAGGWYVKGVFDDRAKLKVELAEERAALKTAEELQKGATQAESTTLAQLRAEKEKGDERARNLEAALRKSRNALADCRIDADTLLVLNDEPSAGATGTPAVSSPAAAAVEGGSTCEALAVTFNENHERFNANLTQLLACRGFYNDVRERYCRDTGAC